MRYKTQKRNVTLKDVARQTGYSVNTVSRALRGKDDIAEETIEKIKQTAKEMGYINNTMAASLRLGYSSTIAVILGDISNPHFAIMMKEIENHAQKKGYSAFLLNTNEDSASELKAIKMAINKNVDGIIICPVQQDSENMKFLVNSGVPFIQIGRHSENIEAGFVVCDDELGGYLATSHLLDNGHERILFLNGPSYISSAKERYQGYIRAHEERGVFIDPELVQEVSVSKSAAAEIMEKVKAGNHAFTAILAFSDIIAWETWSWLHQQGFQVPEDYSLVGFDHIQSRMIIPFPLTTISSYKAQMSITAVECLMEKIHPKQESEGRTDQIVIKTALVKGETVRKI